MSNIFFATKDEYEEYQELFNLFATEYNLSLTIAEMDEIIKTSLNTVEKINKS